MLAEVVVGRVWRQPSKGFDEAIDALCLRFDSRVAKSFPCTGSGELTTTGRAASIDSIATIGRPSLK